MYFTDGKWNSLVSRLATRSDCEQLVLLQYTINVKLVGTSPKKALISSLVLVSGSETASGIWPASYMAANRTSTNSAIPAATSGFASRQWIGAGFKLVCAGAATATGAELLAGRGVGATTVGLG